MSLVKGFTDIIAPQNLLPNGFLAINQRGNFTTLSPAKAGDWLVDCWQIASTSVDNLNVEHYRTPGPDYTDVPFLRFKGYGKKGQIIQIINPYSFGAYRPHTATGYISKTPAWLQVGATTIPVEAHMSFYQGNGNISHIKYGRVSNTVSEDRFVTAVDMATNSLAAKMAVVATLMADGEFDFCYANLAVFTGLYANPPAHAIPNFADDLLRCKRYYQSGSTRARMRGCQFNTLAQVNYSITVPFEIEMAGVPSISLTSTLALTHDGSGSVVDDTSNALFQTENVNSKKFNLYTLISTVEPGTRFANYGADISSVWTATI